jgi:hypothetical protein
MSGKTIAIESNFIQLAIPKLNGHHAHGESFAIQKTLKCGETWDY